MKEKFDWNDFLSVFTWRYASEEMRKIFSEFNTRLLWHKLWVSLAKIQTEVGLVSEEEFQDLFDNLEKINIERAHEIEREIGHDVVAEIQAWAEKCLIGSKKIHLGETSMYVVDNADILKMRQGLVIVEFRLASLLESFKNRIIATKRIPCLAYTHLQPGPPTTIGYRLAQYAQDLLIDLKILKAILPLVKAKGTKGAVGTSAVISGLLQGKQMNALEFEQRVMREMDLEPFEVTSQTYPRKVDFLVLTTLASIAQSCHKFAFDIRILQSPGFFEWSEPAREEKVSSSAMPWKRNPNISERICSLAEYVSILPLVAWRNAADSLLERTLDDSANRRIILPEAFLALDEMLLAAQEVIDGLELHDYYIQRNLATYAPFFLTEKVIAELVEKEGMSRQTVHKFINEEIATVAWEAIKEGERNPFINLLKEKLPISDEFKNQLDNMLNPKMHLGDVIKRCSSLCSKISSQLRRSKKVKLEKAAPRF